MKPDHSDIQTEIEAKFAMPDEQTLSGLSTVSSLGSFRLGAATTVEIQDVYFDTQTRAVHEAGFVLRRRTALGEVTMTLKRCAPAADGIYRREEISVQAHGPPRDWPEGAARDMAMNIVGDRPLQALVSIGQRRITRQISVGGRTVGTLSLDDVTARRGRHTDHYLEAEVELGPQGSEDDIARMAQALCGEWGLTPETRSKPERAMAQVEGLLTDAERTQCRSLAARMDLHGRRAAVLLALDGGATQTEAGRVAGMSERRVRHWSAAFRTRGMGVFPRKILAGAAPEGPRRCPSGEERQPAASAEAGFSVSSTMAEAAHLIMTRHFERMKANEAGARSGDDPEHLHDMRVATRRLRAAMMVFEDALDPAQVRPLGKGLRRLGRALGAVRDLDVFWEKTARYLESLPPLQHEELASLRAVWAQAHAAARSRLLEYLDGPRYGRLVAAFEAFLQQPGAIERPPFRGDGSPRPRRVRHALFAVVYSRVAALGAFDEWVSGLDPSLPRLHRLRIAVKRLRYTMEFFRAVLGPEAAHVIGQLRLLQDHLGDIQDSVVASGLLRDYLTWGTWGHVEGAAVPPEPVLAPGVASYLATRQRELAGLLQTFPEWWAEFQRPEFFGRITAALATLEQDESHGEV
ncbi:CHAD domain-containing protein [Candidatus Fermentibacteria bacterium]|nr:CHAD domain-containing protein [Candidatus Fermentibacteria bacterium]